MKKVLFSLLCGFVMGSNVSAQTCASPLPLVSGTWAYTGDTCSASNPLAAFGALISQQNDIVYSYVASGSEVFTIASNGGFFSGDPLVLLLPWCSNSADPIEFGMQGTSMNTSGVTVPGQQYYVIVTADPSSPSNACGQYLMTVQ